MNKNLKKIIAKQSFAIMLFLIFTSLVFSEEGFDIKKGVTIKKDVIDNWGEPTFEKVKNGRECSYYELDDKTGYIVISYDYQNCVSLDEGKVDYYVIAYKNTAIACPNCFRFYNVKVKDSFETMYACDNCGYKFSKTEGIGTYNKRIMDFAILQSISQGR